MDRNLKCEAPVLRWVNVCIAKASAKKIGEIL